MEMESVGWFLFDEEMVLQKGPFETFAEAESHSKPKWSVRPLFMNPRVSSDELAERVRNIAAILSDAGIPDSQVQPLWIVADRVIELSKRVKELETEKNAVTAKTYQYQFQLDSRGFGSQWHDQWKRAAQDAVSAGYATWINDGAVRMHDGATIARREYW